MNSPPLPKPEIVHVTLQATLPPRFAGLVGVYPIGVFRPEFVRTRTQPVHVVVDGLHCACDGTRYRIEHTRALAIGSFIAFDVQSYSDEPVELVLEISGTTLGGWYGEQQLPVGLAALPEKPRQA